MQKIELGDEGWKAHIESYQELDAGSIWQIRRLSMRDYAQQMLRISYAHFIEHRPDDI